MQGSIPILTLSVVAAGALATARFVTAAGAYPAAGAGSRGVTRTLASAAGDLVPMTVLGTELVESGAAVTKDGPVQSDATGRAIDKAAGITLGFAQNAASAAGQMVEVLLIGPAA